MARLVLSLSLVVATVLGGLGLHAVRDQHQLVDAPRLQAALLTFRPTGRAGSAKPVDAAGLSPERSTRTEPAHCRQPRPAQHRRRTGRRFAGRASTAIRPSR